MRIKKTKEELALSNRARTYAWRRNHPEIIKEKQREYQRTHEWKKRGVTRAKVLDLKTKQDNKCAICGKNADKERWEALCIDHDHNTNTPRGLLCRKCNLGLGCFNDNPNLLNSAAIYLQSFSTTNIIY
jgi:hypothetical protein